VGGRVGYPAYMKPFHGGGWVNVYRIGDPGEFQAAHDPSRSWEEKLRAYRRLVDNYYEADRFAEFCDTYLADADDCMAEYIQSAEVDVHLIRTIQGTFPPHEHEQFIAHYRGLLGALVNDQRAAAGNREGLRVSDCLRSVRYLGC
jgi:hypothetical protein